MLPLFGTWLEQTRELQRESYGYDPQDGSDELRWLNYVREQTLAAFVELGEFIQNLAWKPWAKNPRLPDQEEREEAIVEMVDLLHFVANNLTALGVTDEELSLTYGKKMSVNRNRMAGGGH